MRYELKHDKLAAQIYDLVSIEAKTRRKAEGIYQIYEEIGIHRHFTEEEIEYLAQFQHALRPKASLLVYITESKNRLNREKRIADQKERAQWEREKELIERNRVRQQRIGWVMAIAAAVVLILFLLAYDQSRKAEINKEIADKTKQINQDIRRNLEGKTQLTHVLKTELTTFLAQRNQTNKSEAINFANDLQARLPSSFIDIRNWVIYETIEINGEIWMAENLRYNPSKGSYIYDNDPSMEDKYGRLYTWEEALHACPQGWRLPTSEEWQNLEKQFQREGAYYALIKGGISNFNAVLAGNRNQSGSFDGKEEFGNYWSSTQSESNPESAWLFTFVGENKTFTKNEYSKQLGCSCRCVLEKSPISNNK